MPENFSFKKKPIGLLDMLAFKKLVPTRQARIDAAPDTLPALPHVNVLAKSLHPLRQYLKITDICEESPDVRRFRLEPKENALAYFRAGQYLSFFFDIDGAALTRPYSICSSPMDSKEGFYEVCIKNTGGLASKWIFENWKIDSEVVCSGPEGHFYYEEARDAKRIIGIAGGMGITPLRSLARAVAQGSIDATMILFYGCNTGADMLFTEEFRGYEKDGKFKAVYVTADEDIADAESGLITAELVKNYTDVEDASLFVCGPQAMYRYLESELAPLNLTPKTLRQELFGEIKDVAACAGYPAGKEKGTYAITVRMGFETHAITASGGETLLVAFERAGLKPPSRCRSGECGYCRSLMTSGNVFIPPEEETRRQADRATGHIHPCCSFPIEDIEIVVPRSK